MAAEYHGERSSEQELLVRSALIQCSQSNRQWRIRFRHGSKIGILRSFPGVPVTWKMAEKGTEILCVRLQLRTENTVHTATPYEDFCRNEHAQHGSKKIKPYRRPHMGKDRRSGGASGIESDPRNRAEDKKVNGNQKSDQVGG